MFSTGHPMLPYKTSRRSMHCLKEIHKAWCSWRNERWKETEPCPDQPWNKQVLIHWKTKTQLAALTQSTRQTFLSLPCQYRERKNGEKWGGRNKTSFSQIFSKEFFGEGMKKGFFFNCIFLAANVHFIGILLTWHFLVSWMLARGLAIPTHGGWPHDQLGCQGPVIEWRPSVLLTLLRELVAADCQALGRHTTDE